jgi:PAS domain S-box-containing protein
MDLRGLALSVARRWFSWLPWLIGIVGALVTVGLVRQLPGAWSRAAIDVWGVGLVLTFLLARMLWLAQQAREGAAAHESAEEQFRYFMDNSDDLIEITSASGKLLYVNHAWLRTFGYGATEWATEGSDTMVVAEHAAAYRDMRARLLAGGEQSVFEGVFRTRQGRRVVLSVRGACRMEGGSAVAIRSILHDVTAQRTAEEARARLVGTLEATTDFVSVADIRGRAEYINRAGRRLIGIAETEPVSSVELSGIYTPEARQYALDVIIPAATRDGVWQGETTVLTREGREIPVSQVVVAHESARGGVWFLSTIMRDISAQKQREKELVVLNATASAIADAPDLESAYQIAVGQLCEVTAWPYGEVWNVRPDGQALARSAVWHTGEPHLEVFAETGASFEFSRGEGLPGRVWEKARPAWVHDIATEGDCPRAPAAVAVGLHGAVAVPVMAGDELVAVLSFHMSGLSDEDAYRVRLVAVVAAQLGTHMLRKRAEAAVRESEERFRRLSDASTDGIAVSRAGRFLEVNQAWCNMFGYTEAELVGGMVAIDLVIPEDRERVAASIAANKLSAYRATGLRKDGTTFDADITGTAIMHKGRPARVTVLRDITHWRRLDRLKNEFVSTVSHELRTPLTSIRGSLGLLEGGAVGALSPQGLDLVRIARGNSERLIRLINDMLDLDKIEAGKLELRPTTLMPADVMQAAVDGIRPMAEQFKMRLVEHVVAHRTFPGDRDRVVQVITNLLSNAIKFSPEGSTVEVSAVEIGTIPVALSSASNGGSSGPTVVRFAVENPGPGIAPGDVGRLFARFQQLDGSDTRRRGGTGLGLAISKAIVEQHGGTIGVHSEPNVKTTFWFELPTASPTRFPRQSSVVARVIGPAALGVTGTR